MTNAASTSKIRTNYDVFLSFRGEDTRHGFTGHLYDALCRHGVNTFRDDENLRTGETIGPQLVQSIQDSKISIIVFSTKYAASAWCLDELVQILHCHKERNQLVFPVFYKVDPSDVRHQRNTYKEAMDAHQIRLGCHSLKVKIWKEALAEISNKSGFHLKQGNWGREIERMKESEREGEREKQGMKREEEEGVAAKLLTWRECERIEGERE
ncbi:hypothetical protein PIB30_026956 [Stylosanthes scabra]|uniref:TIR domain-containing protein n=1 Tax=Stylosanthes scabra TaxID=79078 RepID=A0ABU6Z898_9FABA|nr:hypothetical protein [Stylosanthes scabra]